MKIVIFGDVHGNVYALEKLFSLEHDADLFICHGDLVGYGPHNDACIELLQTVNHVYLRGNHEDMFIAGSYHESCSDLAKKFFSYSYKNYSRQTYHALLSGLPETYQCGGFTCIHTLARRHIYPNTNFSELNEKGSYIIGHSHIQFDKTDGELRIVNTGSLGQNRGEINIGEYLVYDDEINEVQFRKIENIEITKMISDMESLSYDNELIDYYKSKI